jgi:predicted amidohydrolase
MKEAHPLNREVTIGLIQIDCRLKDLDYNKGKAYRLISEAVKKGADIVCLPELFTSGYNPDAIGWKWYHFSEDDKGQTVQELSKLARDLKVSIIAPMAEKRDLTGVFYNSAIFINEDGSVLGSYAKTHLWSMERNYFRPGNSLSVFNTRLGKIGILICYDILFPELARELTLAGAEIIFVPSAWRGSEADVWDTVMPARALENTVYLAAVNRVGTEGDATLFGGSCLINPRGRFIAQAKRYEEDMLIQTINLDELSRYRYDLPYLRDHQPDLYSNISGRVKIFNAPSREYHPFPMEPPLVADVEVKTRKAK